ncbi:hypothetical protein [Dyella sp.]|jgi:hypothetical protein|uniref:hypothetical protein n=1 Tax=Dyella sp. TaxID=1869338 RepID=UPI002D771E20|nr:hypothetical protein [Dyella sp.]HET6432381.1 hypothetical protein [Dyella sp.]
MKKSRNPWWISLACVLLCLVGGCRRTPDEVAVRQAVNSAQSAAEQVDAADFSAYLADDFSGNEGDVDRRQLVNLLRVARLRDESIHVLMGPVTVEPRGARYVARFTVTLTSGGRLLPSDMGVYEVESAWRREGGDWICYAASWKRPL